MKEKITIVLKVIHCNNTSESGHDEVFIKYTIDGGLEKRFPDKGYHALADGEDWEVDLPLTFSDNVIVALYDEDHSKRPSTADFLGSHTYFATDPQPEKANVSAPNGANYDLFTEKED